MQDILINRDELLSKRTGARGRRLFAALVATTALIAGACGGSGGDDTSDPTADADTESPTEDPSPNASTGDTDPPDSDTTEPDAPDQTDGSSRPDPYAVIKFADGPAPPSEPAAASSAEDHVRAMLTEVTATLASDDRAVNGALLDVLDRDTWSTIPELAIASAAAQGSIHGEVYGIIESYSLVGASASYGAAENAYFEQRATAAGALATQGQALHDAASGARGLDLTGRACFAVALIEDPDDCDFDTEAEALVATLLAAFEVDIDMPDDFDDDIWTVLDFCAVYAEAASSLDAAQQERIDFAIDDSFLDTRFLGRSDCRFEAGLVEDPQPDLRVGRAALESLYGGVISVGLDLEFDNDFYDNAPEDAYTLGVRTTLSAHGTGAGSAALEVLDGVNEPFLRAALAGIAMAGADEGWFQQTAIDIGLTDEMLACVDSEASDPAAACDPANADVIERAFFIGLGDFNLSYGLDDISDWDEVSDLYDQCSVWADALSSLGPEADRVDFQIGQLHLDDLLGLADC